VGKLKNAPVARNISWKKLRPAEHVVQIYNYEEDLLKTLENFTAHGLEGGYCVAIIATANHLDELERRLKVRGVNVPAAIKEHHYIALDATRTLAKLTEGGWPNEDKFSAMIEGILELAAQSGRPLRTFGELVALLWAKGQHAAALRLESLWGKHSMKHSFSLFHAYPRAEFTNFHLKSLADICDMHSRVLQ
jgi:hypothetical protein